MDNINRGLHESIANPLDERVSFTKTVFNSGAHSLAPEAHCYHPLDLTLLCTTFRRFSTAWIHAKAFGTLMVLETWRPVIFWALPGFALPIDKARKLLFALMASAKPHSHLNTAKWRKLLRFIPLVGADACSQRSLQLVVRLLTGL